MLANGHPKLRRKIPPWCAGVCLVLAVLFLYNPFFTIYSSSGVPAVRHPPSYRGTVASSELRRSVVKQVQPKIDATEEAIFDAVTLPETAYRDSVVVAYELPRSMQEAVLESLWFRPPPSSLVLRVKR
jgi:hypothetical protein